MGSQPMGSLYFRSSDFDSLPKSNCNLSNQTAISAIRLQSQQSDCNLSNQNKTPSNMPDPLLGAVACIVSCETFAISAIRLQSKQSDCNLHNQTAIFTINEQILPCRTYRGPHSRVCQAPSALFKTAISAIRLQSQQSDCNPHNQTAISTIQLQSPQSNCNPSNQTAISAIRLQSPQSDSNLYNWTVISTNRLQSPQSDCNLHSQ